MEVWGRRMQHVRFNARPVSAPSPRGLPPRSLSRSVPPVTAVPRQGARRAAESQPTPKTGTHLQSGCDAGARLRGRGDHLPDAARCIVGAQGVLRLSRRGCASETGETKGRECVKSGFFFSHNETTLKTQSKNKHRPSKKHTEKTAPPHTSIIVNHAFRYGSSDSPAAASKSATSARARRATPSSPSSNSSPKKGSASGSNGR